MAAKRSPTGPLRLALRAHRERPDTQFAKRFGVSRSTVARVRAELGLPAHTPGRQQTAKPARTAPRVTSPQRPARLHAQPVPVVDTILRGGGSPASFAAGVA